MRDPQVLGSYSILVGETGAVRGAVAAETWWRILGADLVYPMILHEDDNDMIKIGTRSAGGGSLQDGNRRGWTGKACCY